APSAPPDTLAGVTLLTYAWAREQSRGGFQSVDTHADDPAVLIYTSGTTGNPKGALHAHRVLIGHLPGFELSHDFLPQPGDRFWTPADWAWIGGLMDALLAAWYHAVPMVAYRGPGGFDPERAFWLMSRQGVRNAFIPPTALKMMAQVPEPLTRNPCALRSIMSGGEALGAETLAWAENTLGVRINEIYGQTEINYIVGNCAPLWPVRPGSMGRPYPGHTVAVVDASGTPVPPGVVGEIAVRRDNDPVFFLEYWNQPRATREKFIGPWGLTGDLAECDPEGYLWFKGRKDDVIISAGYRIGPAEVEAALQRHPAVGLAAVVASPDPVRGHIVKAFVRPRPGFSPTTELAVEIKNFVKERLARHEYPREIEFLQEFPLTTTGKIRRKDLRTLEEARKGEKGAFPE
ncbi:MAG: AMP-binding protein, partial [Deltaproteobacteria bacterium]|nr:AMP-binding protein [Deltaproteobacteria bacterium]